MMLRRRTLVHLAIVASVLVATWVAAGVVGLAWIIGTVLAVWMAIAVGRLWMCLARRSRAQCVVCGYPVRPSGGRCSECGTGREDCERRIVRSRAIVGVLALSFVAGAVLTSQFVQRIRDRLPEGVLAMLLIVPTDPVWIECLGRDASGMLAENGPVRRACATFAASESFSSEHRMWAAQIAAHVKPTEAATEHRLRSLLRIGNPRIASEVYCAMVIARVPMEMFDDDVALAIRERRLLGVCVTDLLHTRCNAFVGMPATGAALRTQYQNGTLPSDVDVAKFKDCLDTKQ